MHSEVISMPIVMGGFSGGPGSRYQLVRTNYLIARLFPGNNYNDTGARNFLTLVNQRVVLALVLETILESHLT